MSAARASTSQEHVATMSVFHGISPSSSGSGVKVNSTHFDNNNTEK